MVLRISDFNVKVNILIFCVVGWTSAYNGLLMMDNNFYVSLKSGPLQKQFISQISPIRQILLLHSFQSWLCNKLTTHE